MMAAMAGVHTMYQWNKKLAKPRSLWVKPWLSQRQRAENGACNNIMDELRSGDTSSFSNFVRMDDRAFSELLIIIRPMIEKKDSNSERQYQQRND